MPAQFRDRLSTKEAARILDLSAYTLQKWRQGEKDWTKTNQKGPRYADVNGRIWYRRDWLEEWADSAQLTACLQ